MNDKLNDNDKRRIEQAAKLSWKNTITAFEDSDEISFWEGYLTGAEYATLYERQQQTPKENIYNLCERIKELEQLGFDQLETQRQQSQYIKQLEAERSELVGKLQARLERCRKVSGYSSGFSDIHNEIDFLDLLLNSLKK